VRAARVLILTSDTPSTITGSPFVGREEELRFLREAFERCVAERACRLVTVLGVPGIGKSRLVREALDEIRTGAGIVVGRCPPYREGITYLPLLDIVRQLAPAGAADLTALVEGEDDGALIANTVAGAVGLSATSAPTAETNWAVRKLLEGLARRRPLVVVLDDSTGRSRPSSTSSSMWPDRPAMFRSWSSAWRGRSSWMRVRDGRRPRTTRRWCA
jgi:Cdc6-like AAA superfamily ATPase